MSESLRRQVGRLLIAGLEGPVLTATERAWLKLVRPGGVILFRRNIETVEQTVALLREVSEIAGGSIFRCVDLEGGLVDRLRDLIAPMPSAAAVFAMGKPAFYKQHGRLIAQEAKLLGFNTVFAPVLDLALPESSAVMRTRVVSARAEEVTAYASSFLEGFEAEEILGCGKHFPGLGGGDLDSHQATPVIGRSWETMWKEDMAPFRALAGRLPMVMVSHAVYAQAAKERKPASISEFWISEVLRRKIKYPGLIVSDDMEMGGILTQKSMEDAVVEAVFAGTNLIEICKDPVLVLTSYEALLARAEKSAAFRQKIMSSCRRISKAMPGKSLPMRPGRVQVSRLQEKIKVFSAINITSFSSFASVRDCNMGKISNK
jgi:beta-N-acetylhexosaminidase